jgi:hypothetical protein
MDHKDSIYKFSELIELDDAPIGGKKAGKRGRGALEVKSCLDPLVIVSIQALGGIAMEAVESTSIKTIESFAKHRILANQEVHTDDLHANKGIHPMSLISQR